MGTLLYLNLREDLPSFLMLLLLLFVFVVGTIVRAIINFRSELGPQNFLIKRRFAGRTIGGGFKIPYELHLFCRRKYDYLYGIARMQEETSRQNLAAAYHDEIFLPYFEAHSYFFYFDWWGEDNDSRPHDYSTSPIAQFAAEKGEIDLKRIPATTIRVSAEEHPFEKDGCEVKAHFHNSPFTDGMIEENYAMLTDEQKKEIEGDSRYGTLVESIAVAALKRRLEFLGGWSKQEYQTPMYSLVIERAGRLVRIRWRLTSDFPSGHELVGFRKTGGFYIDQWSEDYNGMLVVHDYGDSEVTETLSEGEANFYTFFVRSKPRPPEGARAKASPQRFQITVSSKAETEEIKATLERAEQRKLADPRGNMSQALKELGLVMEFDEAVDEMEKSLIERIKKKNLSKEEEEVKIEFVRDAARLQRDKYQP